MTGPFNHPGDGAARVDLPAVIVLSDRHQAATAGHTLPDLVESLCDVGDIWFLFRERDLTGAEQGLDQAVAEVGNLLGLPLLVVSDPHLARRLGATGVHLRANDPVVRDRPVVLGRSCHGRYDLPAAATQRLDYITMSPVYLTTSKPGYGPPVGVEGVTEVCEHTDIPVYVLGGIEPGTAGACIDAGARGVAVMGAIMRAADPAAVTRSLVDEVHAARSRVRP